MIGQVLTNGRKEWWAGGTMYNKYVYYDYYAKSQVIQN